jgi:diguanylate cyclase (GGDEF)-like protein
VANWSAQQLVEFSTSLAPYGDEASVVHAAIERAAEAFEAEVAAVVRERSVVAAVGFPTGRIPEFEVLAVADGRSDTLQVPGVGVCAAVAVAIEDERIGSFIVARALDEPFTQEETSLLRGMVRMLALTLSSLHALEAERAIRAESERHAREKEEALATLRERQTLLERLSTIQRSISHRDELQAVLDSIVQGAHDLLGDEIVGLRLIDGHEPEFMVMVSSYGVAADVLAQTLRMPVGEGTGGRAISEGRVVVIEDYTHEAGGLEVFRHQGVRAAMAAPVHENGRVVGSLTVATRRARAYNHSEQEALLAFAEHASLALTDARTVEQQLYQAFHDPLTGLANRARFFDRLESAIADPSSQTVAVLFIDLDGFKVVNDSLGHATGDGLLVSVAERITGCLRGSDLAARLGGDEFAILTADGERPADTVPIAQRIIQAIGEPFVVGAREVFITASIGIATRGRHAEDAGELLRNADVAMYKAKTAGKGRYAIFEPGMHAAMVARLDLEADLRGALDREEFVVHYQPIMALESGTLSGFEALVRWQHPDRGLILPGEFIPLAEETGSIVGLGRWVMQQATQDLRDWQREYRVPGELTLSVNVSPRQFQQPSLVRQIAEAIKQAELDPSQIIIEITESVLMQDTESTIAKLWQIKRLGVRLAIDDFGTGYSSLSYLRRFPVDILKVDKSFIDGLLRGPEESALARAIVRLGHSLDLQTVAEGIEEHSQLETLLALRCENGQGYLYAPPLDRADAERFIVEHGGGTHRGLRSVS